MHTYHWGANNDKWANFHYNGDYSGNVIIMLPESIARMEMHPGRPDINEPATASIRVPFKALKAFFIEYLRNQAVDKIEQATSSDLERWAIEMFGSLEK